MAKNYIDNLSEETRKGMLQKAQEGYFTSFAPIGYFNVEKKINGIDKSKSHIIQKIFELYAIGNYSLQQVTEFAFKEGLRSRKDYKLHKSTIHKILRDLIYCGDFLWILWRGVKIYVIFSFSYVLGNGIIIGRRPPYTDIN
jgi:DNA invertase Pin-like site-specific DNA recombinase